jgi:hypothetical protein
MKRDIAERLAATAVDGVTVDQARTIIETFLTQIARCPVCDGSGRIVYGREMVIETRAGDFNAAVLDGGRRIPKGTAGSCPRCGSSEPEENGKGDPEWVAWHCAKGDGDEFCRSDRTGDDGRRVGHAECGFQVMFPYAPVGAAL